MSNHSLQVYRELRESRERAGLDPVSGHRLPSSSKPPPVEHQATEKEFAAVIQEAPCVAEAAVALGLTQWQVRYRCRLLGIRTPTWGRLTGPKEETKGSG